MSVADEKVECRGSLEAMDETREGENVLAVCRTCGWLDGAIEGAC